jgi:hypothetical protein
VANPLKQTNIRKALSTNPETQGQEEEPSQTPQKPAQDRHFSTLSKEQKSKGGFEMFTNIQANSDILRLISGKSKKDENSQKAERSFLTLIEDSYNKIISHESGSIDDSNLDMFVGDKDSNEEPDAMEM